MSQSITYSTTYAFTATGDAQQTAAATGGNQAQPAPTPPGEYATWKDLAAMVLWIQLIGLVASEEESSSSSSSKPEDEDSGGKPLSTEAIIGIVAGIATIIATIIAAYMCCCRG